MRLFLNLPVAWKLAASALLGTVLLGSLVLLVRGETSEISHQKRLMASAAATDRSAADASRGVAALPVLFREIQLAQDEATVTRLMSGLRAQAGEIEAQLRTAAQSGADETVRSTISSLFLPCSPSSPGPERKRG
jgi:hypothetical protein